MANTYTHRLTLLLAAGISSGRLAAGQPYTVVGTGITNCYDNRAVIAPPKPGQPFYGQDAQHPGPAPSYRDHGDGTVSDLNTGLIWIKARGQKLTWEEAVAGAAQCRTGGHDDWRLPAIKELYSLILFTGECHGIDISRPFLNTNYFDFAYGDESKGERLIDCQDWSATAYVGTTMGGIPTVFGVNFADGRIKGYGKLRPGPGGAARTQTKLYARYVRGNPAYGKNDFRDHGDGTISDQATGLMWSRDDSGQGMNWEDALAWVAKKNAENYLGHADWRLPNAKELQSLVDYARAPAVTHSPAISPLFQVTKLPDGDYPFFWSGTTHVDGPPVQPGNAAAYVAFGRATGWMGPRGGSGPGRGPGPGGPGGFGPPGEGPPPGFGPPEGPGMGPGPGEGPPPGFGPPPRGGGALRLLDVHGAGAQRSDPKAGDPARFPYGRGPQGDVIRILNFVRLVRGGTNG